MTQPTLPGMTLTIDLDETLRILREIVDEFGPDYKDPNSRPNEHGDVSCRYLQYDDNDKPVAPSCIVGQFMHRVGVPLDAMIDWDAKSLQFRTVEREGLLTPLGIEFTNAAATALSVAQGNQDAGYAWGAAVNRAAARAYDAIEAAV